MVIANHKLYSLKASREHILQKSPPMNLGLREAAGNAKNFSESVLVYSDCLQHCHVSDVTVVPHFLIVCIEVEVYDMPQISLSKFFKILIKK